MTIEQREYYAKRRYIRYNTALNCLEIDLNENGDVALFDEDDLEKILPYTWSKGVARHTKQVYSKANIPDGKKFKTVAMRRLVLPVPKGWHTDHINGNGLDNRKINLRKASVAQNMMNKTKNHNSMSKYKGVTKHHNGWRARICKDYKPYRLGTFGTQEEAARAYDKKALELFGEFARLNFED